MAFSDWAGNSLAEKYGTSNYHIKWLIDEDGNVFKPQESSSYYWNTDQAFGASTPVNVSVYSGDGNISQDYETTIHMPLKIYKTLIHTETGSLNTDYLQPYAQPILTFTPTIPISGGIDKSYLSNPDLLWDASYGTNILTSSYMDGSFKFPLGLLYYSSSYIQSYTQVNQNNSGWGDNLPFANIQYGDQIRFDSNENKTWTILSASFDPSRGYEMYLFLDKPINNLDLGLGSFSIRRLVDDAGFIMIDNNPQQQTGRAPSFIIPKYPSPTLKNNLNNIIQNLYQKNLL
jgi:hypothetical protein